MNNKERHEIVAALLEAADTLEAGKVSADAAAEVARLTDRNHHSEAMAVAAEAIGDRKLAAAFRAIDLLQLTLGSSRYGNDLIKIRYELYTKRLKPQLQKKAPEILQAL